MSYTKLSIPVDQRGQVIQRSMGLPIMNRSLYLGSATQWSIIHDLSESKHLPRVFTGIAVRNPSASSGIILAAVEDIVADKGNEFEFLEIGVQQYFTLDRLMFGPGVIDESEEFRVKYILGKLTVAQGTQATATIDYSGPIQPSDGDTVTVDGIVYEFSNDTSGSGSQDYVVAIGATADLSWTALVNKINLTQYSVTASINTGTDIVTLTANPGGTSGNAITLAESGTGATLSGATLASGSGGVNASFHIW